jgi:hypothetical protein
MTWESRKQVRTSIGLEMSLGCSHLGSHRPFALQFGLVPVKCLLPAVLQISAAVMFGQTMLSKGIENMIIR